VDGGVASIAIRPFRRADREDVLEALRVCGVFGEEELIVAREVIDAGLGTGLDGDYPLFVAEVDGRARGYVCVGKTPLTHGTWHLYWICVHPASQGLGLGRRLQIEAEQFVQARGGERLLLETSSTPGYATARAFYERAGYTIVGRVADFYKPGDDCVMYCKVFPKPAAS
jgi:ribosomal protein S18 acetylase RimI-like enzyme